MPTGEKQLNALQPPSETDEVEKVFAALKREPKDGGVPNRYALRQLESRWSSRPGKPVKGVQGRIQDVEPKLPWGETACSLLKRMSRSEFKLRQGGREGSLLEVDLWVFTPDEVLVGDNSGLSMIPKRGEPHAIVLCTAGSHSHVDLSWSAHFEGRDFLLLRQNVELETAFPRPIRQVRVWTFRS